MVALSQVDHPGTHHYHNPCCSTGHAKPPPPMSLAFPSLCQLWIRFNQRIMVLTHSLSDKETQLQEPARGSCDVSLLSALKSIMVNPWPSSQSNSLYCCIANQEYETQSRLLSTTSQHSLSDFRFHSSTVNKRVSPTSPRLASFACLNLFSQGLLSRPSMRSLTLKLSVDHRSFQNQTAGDLSQKDRAADLFSPKSWRLTDSPTVYMSTLRRNDTQSLLVFAYSAACPV